MKYIQTKGSSLATNKKTELQLFKTGNLYTYKNPFLVFEENRLDHLNGSDL